MITSSYTAQTAVSDSTDITQHFVTTSEIIRRAGQPHRTTAHPTRRGTRRHFQAATAGLRPCLAPARPHPEGIAQRAAAKLPLQHHRRAFGSVDSKGDSERAIEARGRVSCFVTVGVGTQTASQQGV